MTTRPATVDDYMRLASNMAQKLAEYLYDHEEGKGKEAADAYVAARTELHCALVSGVVEVTDGAKEGEPRRWIEQWRGSGPDRGWWIYEADHGDGIAYCGEGEFAQRLCSLIVQKHNAGIASAKGGA